MDKQKKQLIILVVLLAGLGGFALYQFGVFDGEPEPAPQQQKSAEAGAEPAAPPAPAGSAGAPVVADQDLELPTELFEFKAKEYLWTPAVGREGGGRDWEPGEGELLPFDPLRVKNVDIVNPELRRYIDEVKKNWVVVGITRTWQLVTEEIPAPPEAGDGSGEGATPENGEGEAPREEPPADPDTEGQPTDPNAENEAEPKQKFVEVQRRRLVTEVWFQGRRAPFRKNDRLTGTRFVIADIVFGRDRKDPNLTPRALVRLHGDSGEQLDLELAPWGRYGEDDAARGGD